MGKLKMKILKLVITTALLAMGNAMANDNASDNDPYALEPCINGGVSASGLFPNQEAEFASIEAEFASIEASTESGKEAPEK